MKAITLGGMMILFLLAGCTTTTQNTQDAPAQLIVINEAGAQEVDVIQKPRVPLVYEVEHELTAQEWIKASADKRSTLNELYIAQEDARQEQERQDMVKSKNWQTRVDGRLVTGYDVIRDQKGEFDDYPTAPKSERFLYHIEEFE